MSGGAKHGGFMKLGVLNRLYGAALDGRTCV